MDSTIYSKENPFSAKVIERYLLTNSHSSKATYHIVLDIEGSGYTYQVGDSIAIIPSNQERLVEKTLRALKLSGEDHVVDKKGQIQTLKHFLTTKANLREVSRKFLQTLAEKQIDSEKQKELLHLLDAENRTLLKTFIEHHEIWDLLEKHKEVAFLPEELPTLVMPLLPRFYSIASSPLLSPNHVHLTVALLTYEAGGHERKGVATHYLAEQALYEQSSVPVYIQPSKDFKLPALDVPIIMIGPGTGVAPFRAFMQERSQKPTRNWLFFGERNKTSDFFYEKEWIDLINANQLRLDTAFSRDQEEKIYVQHKMLANGADFYRWLEEGAFLYVCGDAKRMAKDVEDTLLTIIQTFGKKSEEEAREYIKNLRQQKRYLRDVY